MTTTSKKALDNLRKLNGEKEPATNIQDVVNKRVEYIVKEGFRLGHIAIPEGSKWLTTTLTQLVKEVEEGERDTKADELQSYLNGPFAQAVYEWRPHDYVNFIRKQFLTPTTDKDKVHGVIIGKE